MQKEKDWQIHNVNGELVKSTLVVIFRFKRTSAISSSWYWKNDIPQTSRTNAKVTNILKERANTTNTR